MTRRKIREEIFKALFQAEFHSEEEMPEQVDRFIEDEEHPIIDKEERDYIAEKTNAILEKIVEIDKELNRVAEGWTTARMPKVDLCVLRVAIYEMLYREDIPCGVSINEAVELAKQFGGDRSSAYINGMLGTFAKRIEGEPQA